MVRSAVGPEQSQSSSDIDHHVAHLVADAAGDAHARTIAEARDEMKKRDLCEACFSQSELAKKVSGMTIHASKCDYCGAPAATGWAAGMWGADGTGGEESHFLCEHCQEQEDLKRKGPDRAA